MLPRILFPIYGSIAIQSYGALIAIAIIASSHLVLRDQRRISLISPDLFIQTITMMILVATLGGRLLHLATCYDEYSTITSMLALHEGGFSILGATLAVLAVLPWYLSKHAINVLSFLDLVSTYMPLTQAIARLGCFFAGCCHGIPTAGWYGYTYTDVNSLAPLGIPLHPIQLYSSLTFLLMFGIMLLCKRHPSWPGRDTLIFLSLFSLQRFILDFWRGDRIFSSFRLSYTMSLHQTLALALTLVSLVLLVIGMYHNRKARP